MLENYRILYSHGPPKSGGWKIAGGIANVANVWAIMIGWGYDKEIP